MSSLVLPEPLLALAWLGTAGGAVLTAGGVYLLLVAWLYVGQRRMVYMPGRTVEITPQQAGLAHEDVWLRSAGGARVHGWWVPAASPTAPVILFCHGNAGTVADRLPTLVIFRHMGYATLIFDYQGYGRSEGRPTEAGTYADAAAAWHHLVEERQVPPRRIVVFGRSLGGAIAARLAREYAPGALVLESTFTSVPDLGADLYPWLPVRWLSRYRYDTLAEVRQARCPVAVLHSPGDDMIPHRHGQRLFAAAPDPKVFVALRGSRNGGYLESGDAYARELARVLARFLALAPERDGAGTAPAP